MYYGIIRARIRNISVVYSSWGILFYWLLPDEFCFEHESAWGIHFLWIVCETDLVDRALLESGLRSLDREILDEIYQIAVREDVAIRVLRLYYVHDVYR